MRRTNADGRNNNFDAMRLYLAVSVVVMHVERLTHHFYPVLKPFDLLPQVPMFVALSGFLIPTSFERSRTVGHFAWKRFLRVFPAFVLSWVLVAALFGKSALFPVFLCYVTASLVDHGSVNAPLWSLFVEEVLYVYYAFSRSVLCRWTVWGAWLALACAAAIWVFFGPTDERQGGWIVFACVCSFLSGNILWFYRERPLSGLAILVIAGVMINAVIILPVACSVVILSVVAVFLADRLPRIKFWRFDLSYGCYVYHTPIMLALSRFIHSTVLLLISTLFLSLSLAALSWFFVESPALALKGGVGIRE